MKSIKEPIMAVVVVAVCLLSSCATVPTASPELQQQALRFTPPSGKASVYIYRPYNYIGSAVLFNISLDYREFGTLANSTYLFGNIDPGSHIIRAGAPGASKVTPQEFYAQAGNLYFFKVTIKEMGLIGFSVEPEQVDEIEGRERISKYALSGDNVFAYLPSSDNLIDIKITDANNHIETPLYSVTVPPYNGWYYKKDPTNNDVTWIHKKEADNYYFMRFSTNWVKDQNMKSWPAKKVADHYRNGELLDMNRRGVMTGQYELTDVVLGEDKEGDRQFYTMHFTTIRGQLKTRQSLYLYFPEETGVNRFLVSGYGETIPQNGPAIKSIKSEFLKALYSCEIGFK